MNQMLEGVATQLEECLAEFVDVEAAAQIRAVLNQSLPSAIKATVEACVRGRWIPPAIKSRATEMEALRAARRLAAPPEAADVAAGLERGPDVDPGQDPKE